MFSKNNPEFYNFDYHNTNEHLKRIKVQEYEKNCTEFLSKFDDKVEKELINTDKLSFFTKKIMNCVLSNLSKFNNVLDGDIKRLAITIMLSPLTGALQKENYTKKSPIIFCKLLTLLFNSLNNEKLNNELNFTDEGSNKSGNKFVKDIDAVFKIDSILEKEKKVLNYELAKCNIRNKGVTKWLLMDEFDDELFINADGENKSVTSKASSGKYESDNSQSIKKNIASHVSILYFLQIVTDVYTEHITVRVGLIEKITKLILKLRKATIESDELEEMPHFMKNLADSFGDSYTSGIPNYITSDCSPEDRNKYFNMNLKNKQMIYEKSQDVKLCTKCSSYIPEIFKTKDSRPLLYWYNNQIEKGSIYEIFIKLIFAIKEYEKNSAGQKNDRSQVYKKYLDPNKFKYLYFSHLKKQKKYYTNSFEISLYFDLLVSLIEERLYKDYLCENKISKKVRKEVPSSTMNENEEFFKYQHVDLINNYVTELIERKKYINLCETIKKNLENIIYPVFLDFYKTRELDLQTNTDLSYFSMRQKDKIIIPKMQETLYNVMIGFSNWNALEHFKKESKFVKKLFQGFYEQDIEPLIYQNLMRNEKKQIRTYVEYELGNIFKEEKNSEALICKNEYTCDSIYHKTLSIETNDGENYIVQTLKCSAKKVTWPLEYVLEEEACVTRMDEERYISREMIHWMKKKYFANRCYTLRMNMAIDCLFKLRMQHFLDMITNAENQSMLYRLADYIEIKKPTI